LFAFATVRMSFRVASRIKPVQICSFWLGILIGTEGHQQDETELKLGPNICPLLVCVPGRMALLAVSVTQHNQQTLVLFLAPCSLSFADPSH